MKTHTKKEIANFAISLFTLDPSFFSLLVRQML